ncbi:hypothetical protein [Macrococcus equipercicus]|uniref:Uncharacterized protein n=1 Tax=Macrococcus equipercicus TaxID=69967 RepID=A0A9Q9BNC3_9STAP|nr:hypothetical protein [Macrococcus equipercicus]KAA1042414.1 hypothetical protein ERX35_000600 [Macrococcus equipercicus]UTH14300.1 hypothetical protein KFV11_02755 [Macrococcus equipercicus]
MILLMSISVITVIVLHYLFSRYYAQYFIAYLPAAMTMTALITYPLSGEGNFINRAFLLTIVCQLFVIILLSMRGMLPLTVRCKREWTGLTLVICLLIPLLFSTSDSSVYLSTAYLSISVFITGYILFTLGVIDRPLERSKDSIYRYMTYPVRYGLLLMYSTVILLTFFMPYNYLYILWFLLLILFVLRREQVN